MQTQTIDRRFVQTPSGRAVIDDAASLNRVWVANGALGSGLRALAHEVYRTDPTQKTIRFDTSAQADALYALIKTATKEAEASQYKGALTAEGLPVGADGLVQYMKGGDGLQSLGSYWVKAVDYATAQNLSFKDAPQSEYIPVATGPAFRERLRELVTADADSALSQNPALNAKATQAADRAQSKFLRGGRQLRHGGYFRTADRKVSDLSPRQIETLTRLKQGAKIGVAFGFGQVFGQQNRHGAGWC